MNFETNMYVTTFNFKTNMYITYFEILTQEITLFRLSKKIIDKILQNDKQFFFSLKTSLEVKIL